MEQRAEGAAEEQELSRSDVSRTAGGGGIRTDPLSNHRGYRHGPGQWTYRPTAERRGGDGAARGGATGYRRARYPCLLPHEGRTPRPTGGQRKTKAEGRTA